MQFVYKRFASGIERPIIPIIVRNPLNQQWVRYLALIDSGADCCIFAGEIGELIGLAVTGGTERQVCGVVAGQLRPYYLHEIEIEVGDCRKRRIHARARPEWSWFARPDRFLRPVFVREI